MKKLNCKMGLLLLFLCIFLPGILALAEEEQIFDQAELLDSRQIQQIREQTDLLREKHQMNFVIVTTNDAMGKDTEDYADDFYMDHGFYDNGKAGGLTLLIDMDNRQVWISTAGDMIYYLTDDRIQEVIDRGYEQLKNGEYAACFLNMLEGAADYVEEGIPSDLYIRDTETGKIVKYRSILPWEAALAVAIALAAAAGAAVWVVGSYRMKWGTYKYPYESKSSMKLYVKNDRFVNQVVTTRHIPRNPPPSGGGGGGSVSSTHSSSGGGTFGGGGRGF